jgi:hypothetical protein
MLVHERLNIIIAAARFTSAAGLLRVLPRRVMTTSLLMRSAGVPSLVSIPSTLAAMDGKAGQLLDRIACRAVGAVGLLTELCKDGERFMTVSAHEFIDRHRTPPFTSHWRKNQTFSLNSHDPFHLSIFEKSNRDRSSNVHLRVGAPPALFKAMHFLLISIT